MPLYKEKYFRGGDNVVSSVVPGPIREIIDSQNWEGNLAELSERIVEKQIEMYNEAQKEASERISTHASLLEQSALKIVDSLTGTDDDVRAIAAIPAQLARKAIWDSENLPYNAFRILRRVLQAEGAGTSDQYGSGDFGSRDIDEWILANERTLRDDKRDDWKRGLVDWEIHSDAVFGLDPRTTTSSSALAPRIMHRDNYAGYTLLDELRAPSVILQPSVDAFRTAFTKISGGLLAGLDWKNVFIAGGIVLSSLLSVNERDAEKYASSDIDVYIWGLNPIEANKKVERLFDIWKSNLPEHAKSKTLVVRNSRTITFFSEYPIKRVQIVLKLVKNPKEVLLNFDLDVCAMGYDGSNLLMLPRAARSLESERKLCPHANAHSEVYPRQLATMSSPWISSRATS